MARYILDTESVNFKTAREGGGNPKQRDIDTTPAVVELRVPEIYPICVTERTIQTGITLPSCGCPGVQELQARRLDDGAKREE